MCSTQFRNGSHENGSNSPRESDNYTTGLALSSSHAVYYAEQVYTPYEAKHREDATEKQCYLMPHGQKHRELASERSKDGQCGRGTIIDTGSRFKGRDTKASRQDEKGNRGPDEYMRHGLLPSSAIVRMVMQRHLFDALGKGRQQREENQLKIFKRKQGH